MLSILDIFLFWLHIIIIVFNLIGWIWLRTRKLHFMVVFATTFSWLILGLKYGMGYCFLTDWHWEIKYKLGESGLPASFIKYFFDRYTSMNLPAQMVDYCTAITFVAVVLVTVYINFIQKKNLKRNHLSP